MEICGQLLPIEEVRISSVSLERKQKRVALAHDTHAGVGVAVNAVFNVHLVSAEISRLFCPVQLDLR